MRNQLLIAIYALVLSLSSFADEKADQKFIGLDVRSKMETVFKKAPGAIHIPVSEISADSMSKISKETPIKVFCEVGGRAETAKKKLEQMGYKNVENIGSWREWNKDYAKKD